VVKTIIRNSTRQCIDEKISILTLIEVMIFIAVIKH